MRDRDVQIRGEVAYGGDAERQLHRAASGLAGVLEMAVHLPQAGNDRLARRIDDRRAGWGLDGVGRTDGDDAVAANDNGRPWTHDAPLGVEHISVANDERTRRSWCETSRELGALRVAIGELLRAEHRQHGLDTRTHRHEPADLAGNEVAAVIDPDGV